MAFHLPLVHSTSYDDPGDVLHSLGPIFHVIKSKSYMFDDANSIILGRDSSLSTCSGVR
jgi:hypothetical protein